MNNILRIKMIFNELSHYNKIENKVRKNVKRRTRFVEPKKITQREIEEIDMPDADSCLSIWQSVVVQAFYDLQLSSRNYDQKLRKAKAIAWFGQGVSVVGKRQTDFEFVCELAQLDPHIVMKFAKKVISQQRTNKRQSAFSGFNFRTVRKSSSNRVPKKKK